MDGYIFQSRIARLCLLILIPFQVAAAQQRPADVSVSPYLITITKPDGSPLRIIGKTKNNIAYTETEDGYTLLKNEQNFYEDAKKARGGNLKLSGLKALNATERTKKDKKKLWGILKHLRYKSPFLGTIIKQNGNQPYTR